jgi:uncharacterized membrane protein
MIKQILQLAALSLLECMLVTACMYVGCRLIDDVVAAAMDPSLSLLLEIPVLVFLGALLGFLVVFVATYIVYIILDLADRIAYKVRPSELFSTY